MRATNTTIRLNLDIRNFQRNLQNAQNQLQNFSDRMEQIGNEAAAAVALPLAGIGALATHTAVSFDDAMRKVKAVSGATGEDFDALTGLARELGRTTRFSATEAAEGMQYLAMAGFEVSEITDAMPGMLNLAAAGALDLGRAADIASDTLTGFGLEAGEIGRVSDVLAKAASNANTDITMLGHAMKYVGPVAASAGLSLEETVAAIGRLSDAGIKGSKAGTTLRGAISRLLNPPRAARDAIESLGLTVEDVCPTMNDLATIIGRLGDAGLDAERAMKIFGQEAGPGMLALLNVGEQGLKEFTTALENAEGTAMEMAQTMEAGPGGALREMRSALEDVQIIIGDIIIKALLPLIEVIKKLAGWFSGLHPTIQKTIVAFFGIITVVGLVLVGLAVLVPAIAAVSAGFTALIGTLAKLKVAFAVLTPPKGLIAAAVLAFAALVYVVIQNWKPIREFFVDLWTRIKTFIARTVRAIAETLYNTWNRIKNFIIGIIRAIAEILYNTWSRIRNFVTEIVGAIAEALYSVWSRIRNFITETARAIAETLHNVWNRIKNTAVTAWQGIKSFVSSIWQTLLGFLQNHHPVGIIAKHWSTTKSRTTEIWQRIKQTVANTWNRIVQVISERVNTVRSVVFDGLNAALNSIKNMKSRFFEFGRGLMNNLIRGIRNAFGALQSVVNQVQSTLNQLNPFSKQSPSLVELVYKGVRAIAEEYKKLSNITISSPKVTPVLDAVSGRGVAAFERTQVISGTTTINGPLVTVNSMVVRGDEDIQLISRELYRLIQNSARGRGLALF